MGQNSELVQSLGFGYTIGYLTDLQILFGDPSYDPILNRIILITKIAIFKDKCHITTVGQIVSILMKQFQNERYLASIKGKLNYFRGFWSPIWRTMIN